MQPTNALVMWSGGIDSTYILAKLLKETDKNIYVHHIVLHNCEMRGNAELDAVNSLVKKIKEIRPFRFTWNVVDDRNLPSLVYDMARVAFESGAVSKAWYYKDFFHGLKKEDWNPIELTELYIGTNAEEGHNWDRWEYLKNAIFAAEYTDQKHLPSWMEARKNFLTYVPHDWVTRREEMLYLKEHDILNECWFCRTPQYDQKEKKYKTCGVCKTCFEVRSIEEL